MSLRILPANFFDDVTDLAVTPAAVATLPVTNLQSNVRSDVWRSRNDSPQVITGTWSGNVRQISAWGIFPPVSGACLIGVRVRVQLYSDAAATAQVYDSGTLDVFAYTGLAWGTFLWGASPWGVDAGDRTARLTPIVKYISAVAASAFKITITSSGALDTPYFEASRIWLADYVDAPFNAKIGAAPAWKSASQQKRAIGGSLRRNRRARWRELRFETMFENESDRSAWLDLMYLCDPANEIVISIFPADSTPKLERDFTVMGSLEALNPVVFENINYHTLQLAIVES